MESKSLLSFNEYELRLLVREELKEFFDVTKKNELKKKDIDIVQSNTTNSLYNYQFIANEDYPTNTQDQIDWFVKLREAGWHKSCIVSTGFIFQREKEDERVSKENFRTLKNFVDNNLK